MILKPYISGILGRILYGNGDGAISGCSCSWPLTGGLTSSACVSGCMVSGVRTTVLRQQQELYLYHSRNTSLYSLYHAIVI